MPQIYRDGVELHGSGLIARPQTAGLPVSCTRVRDVRLAAGGFAGAAQVSAAADQAA